MIIASFLLASGIADTAITQPTYDRDAQRMATKASPDLRKGETEPVSAEPASDAWRPVTPDLVRANSGYSAPKDYPYHLSAKADLDRDGKPDTATLVDNGSEGAIRVVFGDARKPPVIIRQGDRYIGGEGVFAAGPHHLMLNYPETSVVFIGIVKGEFRQRFTGD